MNDTHPHHQLLEELVKKFECHWVALPDKPEESASNSVRALWLLASGDPQSAKRAQQSPLPPLGVEQVERLRGLIDRRLAGVPLAHLTGRQHFLGLELEAGPAALVPREETEILATAALGLLHGLVLEFGEARVLDLCAGSGNIATALAHYEPRCHVWAADLSPEAFLLARRNAERHQLENRIQFFTGDLFGPFAGEEFRQHFDLIVCNPPYISTRKVSELPVETGQHEPRLAFDGGNFGLSVITRLIQESPRYLKPASWLCFEVGLGQGDFLYRSLEKHPAYTEVRRLLDHRNQVRALAVRTRAEDPGLP